jgi:hypothetical protein
MKLLKYALLSLNNLPRMRYVSSFVSGPATAETKDRQAGGERRYPEIHQDRHHGTYIQLSHSLDQID